MIDLIRNINIFTKDFDRKKYEEYRLMNSILEDDRYIQYIYQSILNIISIIEDSKVKINKSKMVMLLKYFQTSFVIFTTKLDDDGLYNYTYEIKYNVSDGPVYIYILGDIIKRAVSDNIDKSLDKISLKEIKLYLLIGLMKRNIANINELYYMVKDMVTLTDFTIHIVDVLDLNKCTEGDLYNLLNIQIDIDTEFILTVNDIVYRISIKEI